MGKAQAGPSARPAAYASVSQHLPQQHEQPAAALAPLAARQILLQMSATTLVLIGIIKCIHLSNRATSSASHSRTECLFIAGLHWQCEGASEGPSPKAAGN